MSQPHSRSRLFLSLRISPALLCAVALSSLLTACGKGPDSGTAKSADKTAPEYETLDGKSGRFSDLHGRWVFVNYWAEWCKPCLKELPALKAFNEQYSQQAVVLTVNFDGVTDAVLREQVQRLKIEVPVLLSDPATRLGIERPMGLPTTYVFDPQGKLATKLEGEQTLESLAAAITAATPATEAPKS